MRRAQRAAEAGLATGIALLRSASDNEGSAAGSTVSALTVERIKAGDGR